MSESRLYDAKNKASIRKAAVNLSRWGICIVSLVLVCLGTAQGMEKQKFIAVGDHDFPPYEFLQTGKPTGFNIELIRAVAEVMGLEVEVRSGPWDKILNDLENERHGVLDEAASFLQKPFSIRTLSEKVRQAQES